MVKLQAGLNRVIVREIEAKTTTKGGLVIPETSKDKPNMGVVVEVGDKSEDFTNLNVVIGDTVVYGKYAGTEFEFENEDYKAIEMKDIVAMISDVNDAE